MELSVMSPVLNNMGLEEAIKYLGSLKVDSMELGVGGYPGKALCDAADFLANPEKIENLKKLLAENNIKLSALACHGNPIHPDKKTAKQFEDDFNNAVLLAEKLGVHQINTFSGCPGDCETAKYPNWVTCPWPNDFGEILEYQWNEVLIPYWKEFVKFSTAHGVDKIALELHPGFCVYNTESLLKLRNAVGKEIGANLDLSHLIWQGMDPIAVIRTLGKEGAIFHFHAKDTKIDAINTAVNGVLDTKSYADEINRSWIFRSVGFGNGESYWRDVISNLRMVGYDYAISIEHEDSLMSQNEGLEKAVSLLKNCIIKEGLEAAWWI